MLLCPTPSSHLSALLNCWSLSSTMTPFRYHFPLSWGRWSNQSEEVSLSAPRAPQRSIALLIEFKCWNVEASYLYTTSACYASVSVSMFAGSGSCRFSYSDPSITVSYSLSSSANTSDGWITLEKIRSLSSPLHPSFPFIPQSLHLLWTPTQCFLLILTSPSQFVIACLPPLYRIPLSLPSCFYQAFHNGTGCGATIFSCCKCVFVLMQNPVHWSAFIWTHSNSISISFISHISPTHAHQHPYVVSFCLLQSSHQQQHCHSSTSPATSHEGR